MPEKPFEPIEPVALAWPRLRDLRGGGFARSLAREAAGARGARRRAILRDLAFRLAGRVTPSLGVEVDGVRYHLSTADLEISRIVFIYGLYDLPLMHAAFAALERLGGAADLRGQLLLDAGANIGTTTLTAITKFGADGAIAFEPDPVNLAYLHLNLADNGLASRVDIHAVALSDVEGTAHLHRSGDNSGDHRIVESGEADPDSIEVAAATLDDLVAGDAVDLARVGLASIDVQGHEGQLLAGARTLLESPIPIVVEYWPGGLEAAGQLAQFDDIVAEYYDRFVDLGGPRGKPDFEPRPASELARVAERHAGTADDHTDLLLVPRALVR